MNPLVTIANHTDDHVICINCTNEELEYEINNCKLKLTSMVGDKYINTISYPNGDFDERVKNIVVANKLIAGFSTVPKAINESVDLFEIPRLGVVDNLPFSENVLHAVGIWQPITIMFRKLMGKGIS